MYFLASIVMYFKYEFIYVSHAMSLLCCTLNYVMQFLVSLVGLIAHLTIYLLNLCVFALPNFAQVSESGSSCWPMLGWQTAFLAAC